MWYIIFLPISALLFLAACEKNTLNSDTDSVNRPVVEAFLQPGATPVVFVKKQIPYNGSDTIQLPLTDLNISIEQVESGAVYLLSHSDSSAYTGSGWDPQSKQTYRLRFEYNGKTVVSETVIPTKPVDFQASALSIEAFDPSGFTPGSGTPPVFPDPIELTWDATDGGYYLVVVECAETDPELIFSDTTQFRPFRAFRSTPAQTNVYELNFLSFRYYGVHHVILYHLNPEYAALYETYGSNSSNLTTPYTNIDGGLGIFTGVCADTLVVTVTQ